MKKKIGIWLLLVLFMLSVVGCSEKDGKDTSLADKPAKKQEQLTTEVLQEYYNVSVDSAITFLKEILDGTDLKGIHEKAKKEIDSCDTIIHTIESQEPGSNTEDTQKEVLGLVKAFRQYYTYITENKVEEATKEITIAVVSVEEIAKRCFYGELPPTYKSLDK